MLQGLTNHRKYYTEHYFAELLGGDLKDTPSHELLSQLLTRRRWISPNQRLTLFADQLLDRDDPQKVV